MDVCLCPLENSTHGGLLLLYYAEIRPVVVGVIVDLNYQNPRLPPLDEFLQMKQQPLLTQHLADGKRIAHGT